MTIEKLKLEADSAKAGYKCGLLTKSEAKKAIQPYADAFNAKSRELAEKYNQKPKLFSIASFLK